MVVRCLSALLFLSPCALAEEPELRPQSALESYLADLGLDRLQAELIESRLDTLGGVERLSAARRLADIYARLLSSSSTVAERTDLEQRAETLLRNIPDVESYELRLSLARASFERAERTLERWRLRDAPEPEARDALVRMRELANTFDAMGRDAHQRIQRLESREERARDTDLPIIEARVEQAAQDRSRAFYLAGWAHRYLAEFNEDLRAARDARVSYGWLLNARVGNPAELERVPEGLEALPHVARAMLSVAFTHALAGDRTDADEWYRRVEGAPRLDDDIRAQLPLRRVMMLCAARRWDDARNALIGIDTQRALAGRLAGVFASERLSAEPTDRGAVRLRDSALAMLVADGELGHALAIVEAFGIETIASDGYVGSVVRAAIAYQRLREEHGQQGNASRPATDRILRDRYREVGDRLREALDEPDAEQYAQARPGTLLLLGFSRYYEGAFLAAADDFERAAELGVDSSVEPDALWMTIVALGQAGAPEDEDAERRDRITDLFLGRFPEHPGASTLAMRRSLEREDDPERSIDLLLEIGPSDPAYEGARRRAAELAYVQATDAPQPVRAFRQRRYLEIAEPLLAADRRAAAEDPDAAARAVLTARRILAVALRMDVPDLTRASRAFDAIDGMSQRALISVAGFAGELVFRRAEYALASGDQEAAERQLDRLTRIDPDLARQGDRLLWRVARASWLRTRERADDPVTIDHAERAARVGMRLIESLGESGAALEDDANASLYRSVARASADLWRARNDEEARRQAQRLFASLIEHRAASLESLRGFVEMAVAGHDYEVALEAQRMLVSGLEAGTRPWYAERTLQLELLALVDRGRAREAMRQHVALYPDLAPEPWKQRLADLARSLALDVEGSG